MESPRWYALKVRPRFEWLVAFHLHDRRVEHYLPIRRVTRQSAGHDRSIQLPLFPGYVFCKCAAREPSFFTIPGVLWVLRGGDESSQTLSEHQICELRRIVDAGLRVQPRSFTTVGKVETLENGPLSGVTGILEQRSDKRFLIVSIHLIHSSIAVDLDPSYVLSSRGAARSSAA